MALERFAASCFSEIGFLFGISDTVWLLWSGSFKVVSG
jgi:hypothetical protein